MEKGIARVKRKDLLALPHRGWDKVSRYTSLLICPSGKKHDSGYALIAIIGCRQETPIEIAGYCGDIHWHVENASKRYGPGDMYSKAAFRTDMSYPSGIAHVWGHCQFEVGAALSSTDIKIIGDER